MVVKTHRSFSQMNTYTRCGELYRLRYVDNENYEWKPAAWTALGNGFHTAYEKWEENGRDGSLSDLFEVEYDVALGVLIQEHPDLTTWNKPPRTKTVERDIEIRREAGLGQAEAYEEHCRAAPWELWYDAPRKVLGVEVPFELDLAGIKIKGAVDGILKWPSGRYTLRDIKTGNREVDKRQLGLYRLAINEQYDLDIDYGEFWYTKDGGNREVNLKRYTREYLETVYSQLDQGIRGGIFLPAPGKNCEMCEVKPYCREMSEDR